MNNLKIILAGGNGFLGQVLCRHFAETNEITILSRGRSRVENGLRYENWDARTIGGWANALEGADIVINLVGRSVDCRYNEKNKREILESRVDSTRALGEAIQSCKNPPKLWINSASATIYRHSEDQPMTESEGEIGEGFSVEVCKAWEKTFFDFDLPQTRQVATRIAIILGRTGGAARVLLRLARFGAGGRQGSGNQYFSWMHEDDYARAIAFVAQREEIFGPVNFVAPNPVRNKELMKAICRADGAPFGIPAPKWLLEIGSWIIRTEPELVLKSRYVIPEKLIDDGFGFQYPTVQQALKEITGKH